MNRIVVTAVSVAVLAAVTAAVAPAQAPRALPTPAESVRRSFADVNRRVLEMAKDFPEAKYDFKPTAEVRSFGEVILHIASGNIFGAKAGRGEQVKWDEVDPKTVQGKAAIVALLEKSINDATATLKETPDERFQKSISPWMSVIEHAGEHYGQLVVYYRVNGLVPPESRPKK